MPITLPAGGICAGGVTSNTPEFEKLALTTADVAISAGALALAAASVATLTTDVTTKLLTSNRGIAIGVKSVTAGNAVAVNQAVLTRRNSLAGPTNQFPVPPTPPGI